MPFYSSVHPIRKAQSIKIQMLTLWTNIAQRSEWSNNCTWNFRAYLRIMVPSIVGKLLYRQAMVYSLFTMIIALGADFFAFVCRLGGAVTLKGPCNTLDKGCSHLQLRAKLRDLLVTADTSSSFSIAFVAIFFKVAIDCVHYCNWKEASQWPRYSSSDVTQAHKQGLDWEREKSLEKVTKLPNGLRTVIFGGGTLWPPILSTGCACWLHSESISNFQQVEKNVAGSL